MSVGFFIFHTFKSELISEYNLGSERSRNLLLEFLY
jgi:hypothetical protein